MSSRQDIESLLSQRTLGFIGQAKQVKTAVLVPLVETEAGELAVVFEHRALSLRRQPGEISFPGGHAEPADEDECATAIRETSEELGLPRAQIEYLGALDVLVAWSGLVVHPFVGFLHQFADAKPNPAEVADVFTVPLSRLLAVDPATYDVAIRPQPPDDFPYHLIPGGRAYPWRTTTATQYFYELDGRVVWGLTARILKHFLDVIRTRGV